MTYFSPDIPLMHGGAATIDCYGHAAPMRAVVISVDGPASISVSMEPQNARALADQLIAAADYAEGKA